MSQNKKIKVGTSGWNYNHWRKTFYPEELAKDEWFEYYCEVFHSVEVNSSFYQLPNKEALQHWKDVAPDDFIFAAKASRYITHMKKLNDAKEPFDNYLDRMKILGKKLGPILFQLPPRWSVNLERLESFLELLQDKHKFVFEFRDESWWNDDVYECLRKYNAAFCIFELEKQISPREITSNFVYIRLHGPGAKYEGKYDKQTLAGWRGAFEAWNSDGKEIYMYFDNDQDGYAAQNAMALQEMVNS